MAIVHTKLYKCCVPTSYPLPTRGVTLEQATPGDIYSNYVTGVPACYCEKKLNE